MRQDGLGKIGIYMRLSRDDEKSGESASIEHQRLILLKFAEERGGTVEKEYVDDGWSGTSFERPAVKSMLEDAQAGIIDTIVVKDLSRFGRNYIQVGQYIDYIFPAYGVRFIAVSDNVDTAERNSAAMDMMPIMNVFNEWHAANTSKKIRAVLEASQRSGKYTNWSYPYGYKAGTDENRTALVDEAAAAVVRRIFGLRLQGNSYRAIARLLTDEGIPNPATYYTKLDGNKIDKSFSPYWSPKTVMGILKNPTYTGSTVQHKTTCVSYKNRRVVKLPESARIVKKNAHEAIISKEIWERAQAVNSAAPSGRAGKYGGVRPFSGLLVCADCGKKLKFKSAAPSDKGGSYLCRTYSDLGKKYCTSHIISESALEALVLRDIRSMLTESETDEEKEKERFLRLKQNDRVQNSVEARLKAHEGRIAELEKLIRSAFEDKVLNGMPEGVYKSLCEKYRAEREELLGDIREFEKSLAEKDGEDDAESYLKALKRYRNFPSLTREACLRLIEYITVGERNADGGREIRVFYRFANPENNHG